ncbi:MAG: hypothetical protein D6791_06680 [Chloroflexi bacterium]|nr:MAG: hypothetical protein D6791_06680 [Chloroflexota bacterium]
MSIGIKALEHMQHLVVESGNRPTQEKPLTITLQDERTGVEAEVYAYDSLGVSLGTLSVWGDNRDASLETLAQAISKRVIYLWEPLALIERDLARDQVQMRSSPPLVEDKKIEFYEGRLTRHNGVPRVQFFRYRLPNNEYRRTQVPITLTHEVFRRLIDDLSTILQTPESE